MKNSALLICLVLSITLSSPRYSNAEEPYDESEHEQPTAEIMIMDGLLFRPLSLVGTVIGTAIFTATLPFSILGGNVREAGNVLVVQPAKITFTRCLGCPIKNH